jgi:high mobility group protein B1
MAFEKRLRNDYLFLENLKKFVDSLFDGDTPCHLLNSDVSKKDFAQFFGGSNCKSLNDFNSSKAGKKKQDKKHKLEEFLKDHDLVMYPHSSYSIFLSDAKEKFEKDNPDSTPKEIKQIMTEEWGKMSEKKKKVYEDKYTSRKNEFIEKVRSIDESYCVLFDKSLKPKAPPRPYTLFVKEQMKTIRDENPDIDVKNVMKLAGEKWKSMSEEEKKVYYDQCATTNTTVKSGSAETDDEESNPPPPPKKSSSSKSKKEVKEKETVKETVKEEPKEKSSKEKSEKEVKEKASKVKIPKEPKDTKETKGKVSNGKNTKKNFNSIISSESEDDKPVSSKSKSKSSSSKNPLDAVLDNSDDCETD